MKRVLITGKDSYIGTSVENWLNKWPDEYSVDTLDMRNENWKEYDYSIYDVVYHVAGIAHVSTDHNMDNLYYRVNRDLAIETANKAHDEGVKQFIFMSSGIIYGIDEPVGKKVVVDKDYIPHPFTAYGDSKLQADRAIYNMNSKTFKTVCIRTPMVYGPNCKGNFKLLLKYANKLFLLPKVDNCRSMIYIDNLSNYIKMIIDNCDSGLHWPQNGEYISTNSIIETIRSYNGKKTYYSRILGFIVKVLSCKIPLVRKVYGDLAYSKEITNFNSIVIGFNDGIKSCISSVEK